MILKNLMSQSMRGLWAGAALSGPLLLNPLPGRLAILALIAPLLIHLAIHRFKIRQLFIFDVLLVLFYWTAALVMAALFLSSTPFWKDVFVPLVLAGGCIGIYLVGATDDESRDKVVRGFFYAVCAFAVPIALAGLFKYWLQLNGYVFESMINSCFGRYPQGSTFCGDYNLYGFFMVAASIGFVSMLFRRHLGGRATIALCFCLSATLTAGFFAGSRRYFFVVSLIPIMWIGLTWLHKNWSSSLYKAATTAAFIALLSIPFSQDRPYISDEDIKVVSFQKLIKERRPVSQGMDAGSLRARVVDAEILRQTMGADSSFGFDSRLERWHLAWQMIKESSFIWPRGFSYHKEFSCNFVACEFVDYPHAPILSHWIAFGLIGLISYIAIYVWMGVLILRAGQYGLTSGATFMVLAAIPYSLISGDLIFSLATTIVAMLILHASSIRGSADVRRVNAQ